MKALSLTSETVTLIRAEDGAQVEVANGTDIRPLDDIADKRTLKNQHMRDHDWPCIYDDALYFVDSRELVGRKAWEQHLAQIG